MVEYLKLELNQNYETFRYLDSKINKSLTFIFTNWFLYGILGFCINSNIFTESELLLKAAIIFLLFPLITTMVYLAADVIYHDMLFYKRTILTIVTIEQSLDTHDLLTRFNQWKNSNLWKYSEKFALLYEINMAFIGINVILGFVLFEEYIIIPLIMCIFHIRLLYVNAKARWEIYDNKDEDIKYTKKMEKMAEEMEKNGTYGNYKRKAGMI